MSKRAIGHTESLHQRAVQPISPKGLAQWAQATSTKNSHPNITIPTKVSVDDKERDKNRAGCFIAQCKRPWLFCLDFIWRDSIWSWRKEKFSKTFPQEDMTATALPKKPMLCEVCSRLPRTDKKTKELTPTFCKVEIVTSVAFSSLRITCSPRRLVS